MSDKDKTTENSQVQLTDEELDTVEGGGSGRFSKFKGLTDKPKDTGSVQVSKDEIEVLAWSSGPTLPPETPG